MNPIQIKEKVAAAKNISRLIADNWVLAQTALLEIPNAEYRKIPSGQYLLQLLCLVAGDVEGFHIKNSAEKEQLVEKMKLVFSPVSEILNDKIEIDLPSFSLVSKLIPQNGDSVFFAEQLKEDFKLLHQQAADALATALYGVVYAYYGDFGERNVAHNLCKLIDNPYEIGNFSRITNDEQIDALSVATKNVYVKSQASAYAASDSTYYPKKMLGKWIPLKIYLIVTTLFFALVFGLVLLSMTSGVGTFAMSIMDSSGQMVAIEPDMEPITLILFGTVGYDAMIAGIKMSAIIFFVWRVVLITCVYGFTSCHRRRGK